VNEQFYSFLYFFIAGILPKIFQVRDNGFAKGNDLITNGIVYILIRVINEVKQG
jgi:hypothetical protein